MPLLPPQLQPGRFSTRSDAYRLIHIWPDDSFVKWGTRSVDNGQLKPVDQWAFFTVKLQDPLTFISCDGANFADAEGKAFERYQRALACPGHFFERRGWRNGVGYCIHCDLYSPFAFDSLENCSICGCTTYFSNLGKKWYCETHAPEGNQIHESQVEAAAQELALVGA